jgi:hypothetical protein
MEAFFWRESLIIEQGEFIMGVGSDGKMMG